MKIISTSDNRVSFKEDGYISHNVGHVLNMWLHENEMRVYHKDADKGIFHYNFPSAEAALKASKEIIEQLSK